jgi:hypothetical protein
MGTFNCAAPASIQPVRPSGKVIFSHALSALRPVTGSVSPFCTREITTYAVPGPVRTLTFCSERTVASAPWTAGTGEGCAAGVRAGDNRVAVGGAFVGPGVAVRVGAGTVGATSVALGAGVNVGGTGVGLGAGVNVGGTGVGLGVAVSVGGGTDTVPGVVSSAGVKVGGTGVGLWKAVPVGAGAVGGAGVALGIGVSLGTATALGCTAVKVAKILVMTTASVAEVSTVGLGARQPARTIASTRLAMVNQNRVFIIRGLSATALLVQSDKCRTLDKANPWIRTRFAATYG